MTECARALLRFEQETSKRNLEESGAAHKSDNKEDDDNDGMEQN